MRNALKLERLKEALDYNEETGEFRWKMRTSTRVRVGASTGCVSTTDGYVYIRLDKFLYAAHRLAWMMANGAMPDRNIDHINGNRSDNRISNLRLADFSENARNAKMPVHNKCGVKGVCNHQKTGKWRAQITHQGRQYYFGLFDSIEAAAAAVKDGRARVHGEFANHG